MNPIQTEILTYALTYLLVIIIGFALINFLSNGFFIVFIRVKASRGKKVLVKVRSVLQDYYRIGTIIDNDLEYLDKNKQKRRVNLPKNAIYRSLNLNCIDTDEETNSVVTLDFTVVDGHDAQKTDNLLVRALTKPAALSNFEKIVFVGIVVAIIVAAISAYISYQNLMLIQNVGLQPAGVIAGGNVAGVVG